MRKTVATTLAKIGFDEAGISGVRPLLWEMIEPGVISVRSVLFDLPPGKKTDISADMEGWYMSRADAKKVRDYLRLKFWSKMAEQLSLVVSSGVRRMSSSTKYLYWEIFQ